MKKNQSGSNHLKIALIMFLILMLLISVMFMIFMSNSKNDDASATPDALDSQDAMVDGFSSGLDNISLDNSEALAEPQDDLNTTDEPTENEPYVDNGKPKIAITFDDGPWKKTTNRLLDLLVKYDSKATFFVIGEHASYNKDILKRTSDLGMEIANHTFTHNKLNENNVDVFLQDVEKANDIIEEITGKRANLLRLPGGAFGYSDEAIAKIPYPIFNWNVDTRDWKNRDKQTIIDSIMSNAKEGSIVLVHDIYEPTIDAMEVVIPELINQGYEIVTLETLALSMGVTWENGEIYTNLSKTD